MSAVKSLLLAVELAARQRDRAQTVVLQARQNHLFAQNQLAQLEGYSRETELRWMTAAQLGTAPELMLNHYQFMGRLKQAIDLQQHVVATSLGQLEWVGKALLEAEFRVINLEKVVKKKQAGIAILLGKREQKQMDEFAALQYARSRAERNNGSTYEY